MANAVDTLDGSIVNTRDGVLETEPRRRQRGVPLCETDMSLQARSTLYARVDLPSRRAITSPNGSYLAVSSTSAVGGTS